MSKESQVTPTSRTSPVMQGRMRIGAIVVAVLLVLGLVGWLSANAAANSYETKRTAYLKALKPAAAQLSKTDFSSLVIVDAAETPAQYKAEQTTCAAVHSGYGAFTKAADSRPSLTANPLGFLSSKYKHAKDDVTALDKSSDDQKTLQNHASRLTNACSHYVNLIAIYQADYANANARDALIVNNGENGIECEDNAATCLPRASMGAFKKLMNTQIVAEQKSRDFFQNVKCVYPELEDYCKVEATEGVKYVAALQAYQNALATSKFRSVAPQADIVYVKMNADAKAAIKKAEPVLGKQCSNDQYDDCDGTIVKLMTKQDQQAIAAAAQKLAQIR